MSYTATVYFNMKTLEKTQHDAAILALQAWERASMAAEACNAMMNSDIYDHAAWERLSVEHWKMLLEAERQRDAVLSAAVTC